MADAFSAILGCLSSVEESWYRELIQMCHSARAYVLMLMLMLSTSENQALLLSVYSFNGYAANFAPLMFSGAHLFNEKGRWGFPG